MLKLEDIMRRFVTRQAGDPPTRPLAKLAPSQSPVVINGMVELLAYLANQDKRIAQLEKDLSEVRAQRAP